MLFRSVVSEHHMLEDLEAEWFEESLYLGPLQVYLEEVLGQAAAQSANASRIG